jgi:protein MAK16
MNRNQDDLIWGIIGKKSFCSYKFVSKGQYFCKNEYNTTGFCSRQSCPLSNSKYATIIEKHGELFLYLKDLVNTRYPDKIWKKFILSRNFAKSLQELDLILNLWPKFFVYKTKQKLTKLRQAMIREKLNSMKKKLIGVTRRKKNFFNKTKESKFINKIKFENLIEKELLHRNNLGMYGNLYPSNPIQGWKIEPNNSLYSTVLTKKKSPIKNIKKLKKFV